MDFDLRGAINALDSSTVFEVINAARPPADYVFNAILPEENRNTYDISGGSLIIKTTMAGLAGMDSPYPESGAAMTKEFSGKIAKIANRSRLPEQFLRELQSLLMRLSAQGASTTASIQQTGLNFLNKIIVQAHLDTMEYLRGRALFTGNIDWTYNGKNLAVDYGIPAANFLTPKTSTDAYGGTASKFWDDVYEAQELLDYDVRAIIMSPKTLRTIMANKEVNKLEILQQNGRTGRFTFRRWSTVAGQNIRSTDAGDVVDIIVYNKEGEIWDLANPGLTKKIKFCPDGAVLFVGERVDGSHMIVSEGSTQETASTQEPSPVQLGYTHVGPTVEGNGLPGRWNDLYVPEQDPWTIEARGVTNGLPVIWAPERLVISSTSL